MPKPARRSKHPNAENLEVEFEWLSQFDLTDVEIGRILPAVPGGMTESGTVYVNSMLPKRVFSGREQGSLPLVAGRWFLIPSEIVEAHPRLRDTAVPTAAAASLIANDGPRGLAAWTVGG